LPRAARVLLPVSVSLAAAGAWAGCSDETGGDVGPGGADSAAPEVSSADVAQKKPTRDCAADEGADGLKQHLDCTGLYDDFETKTVAKANKPYRPGLEFWSDAAEKERWLYLPPDAKIDVSDFDAWKFPIGTKVWKAFKIGGKRIETRLYTKTESGVWRHTTYRWNADETDAVRLDSGEKIPFAGRPIYEVPNTNQCAYCHDNRKEPLLGLDAVSLGLSTAQGITIASLLAEGRLEGTPAATQLSIPNDATGKAAAALGFLHVNCGVCHAKDGFAEETGLFMRILPSQLIVGGVAADGGAEAVEQLSAYKTGMCQTATTRLHPDGGTLPILRIAGGDPANSLVSILSGQRAPEGTEPNQNVQMPPLVTRMVDVQGHKLLTDWISALAPCP
jgi:mono/diheme cytochrome c family protein